MTVKDIEQIKITKNTTAVVYIDCQLHPEDRAIQEAALAAKLGCKVVVMDASQQAYFIETRPTKTGEPKATPASLIQLINNCDLSAAVKESLTEWLSYKKYKYETKGFEKLLSITARKLAEFGEAAVIDVIDVSMSNMWAGICWERLKPAQGGRQQQSSVFDRIDTAVSGLGKL